MFKIVMVNDKKSSVNRLSPKSDQHQFSPNNINTWSREKGMRTDEMINKGEKLWSRQYLLAKECIEDSTLENLYLDVGAWVF